MKNAIEILESILADLRSEAKGSNSTCIESIEQHDFSTAEFFNGQEDGLMLAIDIINGHLKRMEA